MTGCGHLAMMQSIRNSIPKEHAIPDDYMQIFEDNFLVDMPKTIIGFREAIGLEGRAPRDYSEKVRTWSLSKEGMQISIKDLKNLLEKFEKLNMNTARIYVDAEREKFYLQADCKIDEDKKVYTIKAYTQNSFMSSYKGLGWEIEPYQNDIKIPKKITRDNQRKLHSLNEAAVQYDHSDGSNDQYWIDGVKFDYTLWKRLVDKEFTPKEAIKLRNLEQKRVAIKQIGYDLILRQLNAKIIDEKDVSVNGKKLKYQVLEVNLKDEWTTRPARFVKVQCPSTMKETLIRVSPWVDSTTTCKGAIAWTFNLSKSDYIPKTEA